MHNLAGIAAMMALSGGFDQGDRSWNDPTRSERFKKKTKACMKRRAANKKASQQRKSK